MFRQDILSKFTPKVKNSLVKRTTQSKDTQVKVVSFKLFSSISVGLPKEILKKLKIFNKKSKKLRNLRNPQLHSHMLKYQHQMLAKS